MAALTGTNLLNSIIESSGVEINALIFNTLSAKLQQMIDNGTYSKLAAGIAMSGFSTVINDATDIGDLSDAIETNTTLIGEADEGEVDSIEFPPIIPPAMEERSIDGTAFDETPETIDAGTGSFKFMDDATVNTHVIIENFSSDDVISFSNAEVNDYFFGNEGEDVTITLNFNDSGVTNTIKLTGVVNSDDLVFNHEAFVDATGFDPFIS
jgi:hypothetical protein